MDTRTYRAGQTVDDVCRACKADRLHTIIVVDEHGRPLRVACGYCGSEHNFRGGPQRDVVPRDAPPDRSRQRAALRPSSDRPPFPLVAESELVGGDVSMDDLQGRDLELLLRRIIRQETGLTPAVPAE